MSRRVSKLRQVIKVTVSFEVSRVADECLASAYEQVVPLVHRAPKVLPGETEVDIFLPRADVVEALGCGRNGKAVSKSKQSWANHEPLERDNPTRGARNLYRQNLDKKLS